MDKNIIYMDNAAATRVDEAVFDAMKPFFFDNYAVATSEFGYSQGLEARESLNNARAQVAASLGAQTEEIIFTSGNTESSNLAIKGVVKALSGKKGRHIIVSKIEDFPVLHCAKELEKEGYEVDYVEVDEYGIINVEQLKKQINDETILVSIQHGNQEIGTVQDIETIGKLCKEKEVLFHTDATHTFMRLPLDVSKINVDLITISAHTIHGPKGIGGLYVRKGTPIEKIMAGGFQEFNIRPGMENIPAAIGFAKAITLVTDEETRKIEKMRENIISLITENIPNTTLNGHTDKRLPHNVNITFHYVEGESITLHLDMYGIAVSTGSACFSRSLEASHVIMAIGGDHERAHGSIRITLGRFNTEDEISTVVDTIAKVVNNLRKISPLGKEGGK